MTERIDDANHIADANKMAPTVLSCCCNVPVIRAPDLDGWMCSGCCYPQPAPFQPAESPPKSESETPTPRTDAEDGVVLDANEEWSQTFDRRIGGGYVPSDFACQLERELDIVTSDRNGVMEINQQHRATIAQLARELVEYKKLFANYDGGAEGLAIHLSANNQLRKELEEERDERATRESEIVQLCYKLAGLEERLTAIMKERDALREELDFTKKAALELGREVELLEEVAALESKIIPRIPYCQCVTCDGSGLDFEGEKCEACGGVGVLVGEKAVTPSEASEPSSASPPPQPPG